MSFMNPCSHRTASLSAVVLLQEESVNGEGWLRMDTGGWGVICGYCM